MHTYNKLFGLVLVVAVTCGISWWLLRENTDSWVGFFFPEGCTAVTPECVSRRVVSLSFPVQDKCMAWGRQMMREHDDIADSFSCELNCRFILGQNKCASIIRVYRTANREGVDRVSEQYGIEAPR